MENNTDNKALMKPRDAGECIKDGYGLFIGNFTRIFKASWHAAIAYSLIVAAIGIMPFALSSALMKVSAYDVPTMMKTLQTTVATLFFLFLAGTVAEITFYSCGISLLKKHSEQGKIDTDVRWFSFDRSTAWRSIKVLLSLGIIAVIGFSAIVFACFFLSDALGLATDSKIRIALPAFGLIVFALALTPAPTGVMKYLMGEKMSVLGAISYGYSKRTSRMMLSLGVLLGTLCITVVAGLIPMLPSLIIATACEQSFSGIAAGDPAGMPGHIYALMAGSFAITAFLTAYIKMPFVFTTYYLYGSIESRKETGDKAETEQKENGK